MWGRDSLLIMLAALVLLGLSASLLGLADTNAALEERLTRYRTLGKAFYENPTTQAQAVEQFRLAWKLKPNSNIERLNYGLSLLRAAKIQEGIAELEAVQKADPALPHTWFNLGIELKKLGETEKAIAQFERMGKLVPSEPITQYNLGVLYKLAGRNEESIAKFQLASRLDPNLAAAHFQLFNAFRQAGRREEAQKELAAFQEIKKQQEASGNTEDVEWSLYSEIYEVIDNKLSAENTAGPALRFTPAKLAGTVDPKTASAMVLDFDGDGTPDLLAWSSSGILLFKSGATAVESGLGRLKEVLGVVAGDYDNDGLVDLCVLTPAGPALYHNVKGTFGKADAALPQQRFEAAVWLDYDHDYDLDLLLLGAQSTLLRNQGAAGFADRTRDFPFQAGQAREAVNFRLIPDSKSLDLIVAYADKPPVLYHDRLGGRYEPEVLTSLTAGLRGWQVADLNNDSYLDVVFRTSGGAMVAYNRGGKINGAEPAGKTGDEFVLADFENRGLLDFLQSNLCARSLGAGRFEAGKAVAGLPAGASWAAADFNNDGRTDLAGVLPDGTVRKYTNATLTKNSWLRVGLTGIKNLKLAPGSEVEVKAGGLYQKKVYRGLPLLFGLRTIPRADTVRITWPNGLIQNEMKQLVAKRYDYKEAQRLSGSCPLIWTWNGTEFEYITDVLGVAPLGASSGDGRHFPTDHDEYIAIPGGSLKPRGGKLEVRITEELSEVTYLDRVQLIAVDHPSSTAVFVNEKWKAPPFPEFRLYGASQPKHPVRATDYRGRDVTGLVARADRRYPDAFPQNMNGVAALHHLDLDFGDVARDNRAVLMLSGWVDWADGSTFLAQAQESAAGLQPPKLQVKDSGGRWVTVIGDMGMPDGKPKTITVDLTGLFLSESREVRIVTNLCVFWDEIFLSEDSSVPETRMTALAPASADLHFRGFSRAVIHPERRQPERFLYAMPAASSFWNPTPGMYTRYGAVRELLSEADDRLLIMGSGDEAGIWFDASRLPALKPGWRRDYLLKVDGWAKDRDANTAYSQSVEPLPFRAMSGYPYPPGEAYPSTPALDQYRKEYNTRPALRLIRALATTGTQSIGANP